MYRIYCFIILLLIANHYIFATETPRRNLQLSMVASLSTANAVKGEDWLDILPDPINDNQFYASSKQGKIFSINGKTISSKPFFDLSSVLPKKDIVSLTAITLSPHFEDKNNKDFFSFYTAHIEKNPNFTQQYIDKNYNLTVQETLNELPYHAVIIRWKMNKNHRDEISISKSSEIFRIATQHPDKQIRQLSFNPFVEQWHRNHNLLYFQFDRDEALADNSLYAGAIFGIQPESFGAKKYIIPENNPFFHKNNIQNEIVFVANKNIKRFAWEKNKENSIFIQYADGNKDYYANVNIGDDWREEDIDRQIEKISDDNVFQSTNHALIYYGRKLKENIGRFVQLYQDNNQWKMKAYLLVQYDPQVKNKPDKEKVIEYILNNNLQSSDLVLLTNLHNELMILDRNEQLIYNVWLQQAAVHKEGNKGIVKQENYIFTVFAIIAVLLLLFWGFKEYKKHTKKHFLFSQWADFKLNEEEKALWLYKRHDKNIGQLLLLADIKSSAILLNDEIVSMVSKEAEQGFTTEKYHDMITRFEKIHRVKMLDDDQRQIHVELTTNNNKKYTICVYYRIGNIRHTKLYYDDVLNFVANWHLYFSRYLKLETCDKPIVEIKQQSSRINTETNNSLKLETESEDNYASVEQASDKLNNTENIKRHIDTTGEAENTDIVSLLGKLILMKEQGAISEEEFIKAKKSLLKSTD